MSIQFPKVTIELVPTVDIDRLVSAAGELGDISLEVIEDPALARARLLGREFVSLGRKYEGESADRLMDAAKSIWPPERVAQHVGKGATHKVTELTFTGGHGRRDLYSMATHGYTHGIGGNL